MYEVEAISERPRREDEKRRSNERRILSQICHRSATVSLERKPQDLNPVEDLTRRFLGRFPQADELDMHALRDQRLSGPPRPHVGGIVREQQYGSPLAF